MEKENWFKKHPVWSVIIGIFILGLIISMFSSNGEDNSSTSEISKKQETGKLSVGDEGRLYIEGLDFVGVATTKEAMDELTKSAVAKDSIGYAKVYSEGRAFQVESNTKILIIGMKVGSRQVRILEGDYYGQSGWVPYEWVVKA